MKFEKQLTLRWLKESHENVNTPLVNQRVPAKRCSLLQGIVSVSITGL